MNIKTTGILTGLIFIAVGLLGFVSNPIIGESHDAIFHADTTHNFVHIVSGLLFITFAAAVPGYTKLFLQVFGVVYFLIGILGLLKIGEAGTTKVLGFLHVNGADNFLHIGLGIVIFLAGTILGKSTVARHQNYW